MLCPHAEYILRDYMYQTAMHTFVWNYQMSEADVLKKQRLRLTLLRRKMNEELESGEKIFVYAVRTPLNAEEMSALADAVAALGPGRLLFVGPTTDPARVGRVESFDGRHLMGFTSRPAVDADGRWDIDFRSWLTICRDAARMHMSASV